jgi:hypothetical protein
MPRRRLLRLVALVSPTLTIVAAGAWFATRSDPAPQPRTGQLVVLVVFDTLRADQLPALPTGRRLADVPAGTQSGPGLATAVTGVSPASHGIVGDSWFDRGKGKLVAAHSSNKSYDRVPANPAGRNRAADGGGFAPDRVVAPTTPDAVRTAGGKVIALASTDRAAILLGGKQPAGCYWWDADAGGFATSAYYRDRLPPWVEAANAARSGEGSGDGADARVRALAKAAIDAEKLGRGTSTDLICLGLSDGSAAAATVRELVATLEASHPGRFAVVVTAARASGDKPAPSAEFTALGEVLDAAFGQRDVSPGRWVERVELPWVYLNRDLCRSAGVPVSEVATVAAAWCRGRESAVAAFAKAEWESSPDPVAKRVKALAHPDRVGDVFVATPDFTREQTVPVLVVGDLPDGWKAPVSPRTRE